MIYLIFILVPFFTVANSHFNMLTKQEFVSIVLKKAMEEDKKCYKFDIYKKKHLICNMIRIEGVRLYARGMLRTSFYFLSYSHDINFLFHKLNIPDLNF